MTGRPSNPRRGFTLVELIVTLVLFGLMAATLVVFLRPAVDSWLAVRTRSALASDADHALRRMLRDVRAAVPNSIRTPGTQCFELVPTGGGGRYRMAADAATAGSLGKSRLDRLRRLKRDLPDNSDTSTVWDTSRHVSSSLPPHGIFAA